MLIVAAALFLIFIASSVLIFCPHYYKTVPFTKIPKSLNPMDSFHLISYLSPWRLFLPISTLLVLLSPCLLLLSFICRHILLFLSFNCCHYFPPDPFLFFLWSLSHISTASNISKSLFLAFSLFSLNCLFHIMWISQRHGLMILTLCYLF